MLFSAVLLLPAFAFCQPALGLPGIGLPTIQLSDSNVSITPVSYESLLAAAPPCSGMGCAVLPVTLLSFDAKRQSNSEVLLNWQTTNEYNNTGFDVERSLGNTTDFIKVAFVPAKSSTSTKKQYELLDNNHFSGTTYYRLKMMDADGKFLYSNIVPVKGFGNAESLSVYPNPVTADAKANISSTLKGLTTLAVLSMEGKVLVQQTISLVQGNNVKKIGLSILPKGVYMIKIQMPSGNVLLSKFIKE